MSKNRNRLANRTALIVAAIGGLVAVIVGVPMYMSAAAAPLHPQPERAPSMMHAAPSPGWSEAVLTSAAVGVLLEKDRLKPRRRRIRNTWASRPRTRRSSRSSGR